LEAGTGHGALTLHLARAIHAANTAPPPAPRIIAPPSLKGKSQANSPEPPAEDPNALAYDEWRRTRSAVISTLDISKDHSFHARKVVRGFRKGLYAGHVDFHVGDLGDFIDSECKRRGVNSHLFNHILLDLPGTHEYIVRAAQALRPDGCLIVFSPSVTQIASCVEVIRRLKLPLSYEQVVELGAGYGGGKQWDVRLTKARKPKVPVPETIAAKRVSAPAPSGFLGMLRNLFRGDPSAAEAVPVTTSGAAKDNYHTVCRPLVGHKVIGGGFVGVWRRKKDWEKFDEEDEVAS
jgi:tRNA (adenine57-N1/adenine58-N1)-methyltransferase